MIKTLRNIYHQSALRTAMHTNRKKLQKYLQSTSPFYVQADAIRRSRTTFKPEAAVSPFHVDIYDGPLLCEGHRGNLFKSLRPVHDAGDGLVPRRRAGNPLAVFAPRKHLDFALSLHTPHPNNYYHFLGHTLTKVVYAEDVLKSDDFPILLSEEMARQVFYQDTVKLGFFGKHPLIVQKRNENYVIGDLVVAKPAHQIEPFVDRVLDRLDIRGRADSNQRVFIQRGPKSANSRNIANMDEVRDLLKRYDFDAVDPQDHSFIEQMRLFSGARYVASPHGAGLTNIAFRRGCPLSVYEIRYLNGHNSCYARMSRYYGYDYTEDYMAGTIGKWTSGTATIDCTRLEDWLKRAA